MSTEEPYNGYQRLYSETLEREIKLRNALYYARGFISQRAVQVGGKHDILETIDEALSANS